MLACICDISEPSEFRTAGDEIVSKGKVVYASRVLARMLLVPDPLVKMPRVSRRLHGEPTRWRRRVFPQIRNDEVGPVLGGRIEFEVNVRDGAIGHLLPPPSLSLAPCLYLGTLFVPVKSDQETGHGRMVRGKPSGGAQLKQLAKRVPDGTDFRALLDGLENPSHSVASRDRYIAIVASGAVEHALRLATERHLAPDLTEGERANLFRQPLGSFASRITMARALGVVSCEEAVELNRIRDVRNAFAHTIEALSFDAPEVTDLLGRMWHYPVADWAAYFAPAFPAHRQFLIICASFYDDLIRHQRRRPRAAPRRRSIGE